MGHNLLLIEIINEKLNLTHITRLELENKVKCIYIDKYKNIKIDFKKNRKENNIWTIKIYK